MIAPASGLGLLEASSVALGVAIVFLAGFLSGVRWARDQVDRRLRREVYEAVLREAFAQDSVDVWDPSRFYDQDREER